MEKRLRQSPTTIGGNSWSGGRSVGFTPECRQPISTLCSSATYSALSPDCMKGIGMAGVSAVSGSTMVLRGQLHNSNRLTGNFDFSIYQKLMIYYIF